MPGSVSCWLYLFLNALENFDISLDLLSYKISNFPMHLNVNTANRKHIMSFFYTCDEYRTGKNSIEYHANKQILNIFLAIVLWVDQTTESRSQCHAQHQHELPRGCA